MKGCNTKVDCVKNAKTTEIIEKWYGRLGFPSVYDSEFKKALSEISISDDITIDTYDCECTDGKRNLLSFLFFAEKLAEEYAELGLPEKVLLDTLYDVVIWTDTWSKVKGELYLGELKWLKCHYTKRLFRIGRLQYAMGKPLYDVEKYGIKKGDSIIEVHIPADGPIDPAECRKSVAMAKEFFAKYYPDFKYEYFSCHSWLLDNNLKEYLKEGSNILEFAKLFDVLYEEDSYALLRYIFKWDTDIENLKDAVCTSSFSERIKKAALRGAKFHESYGFFRR